MGEAKRKAALRERLGESRGDGYDGFLQHIAELRATPGARVDQLDRLRFHELLATAILEGCRERAGELPEPEREVEVMKAACIAAGIALGATFFARIDADEENITLMANLIMQDVASGVMIAAQSELRHNSPTKVEAE